MIRVAFGTTVLERCQARGAVDGIGTYSRELLSRLAKTPGLELQPFAYAGPASGASSAAASNFGPFKLQALFSLATGLPFPVARRSVRGTIDLVHATDHLIPSLGKIPVVATLMDAIPLAHPEWVTYSWQGIKNVLWRRSARWAAHVVTLSTHAKQELIEWFRLPEDRISVTPLGVAGRWFMTPSGTDLERVHTCYALPERFFLFVGTLQPRKNVARLIAAHRMLSRALRKEFPLVVIGRAGWGCEQEVLALSAGDGGALRWLRYVPDADLVPLLSRSSALVFPSLHEGFGLPVLEAFAAGVPVITSNTTALPEVAGDAALLVDPLQPGEIAEAMRTLVENEPLAEQLRKRGRARAAAYTWDRTATLTAEVYGRVLAAR